MDIEQIVAAMPRAANPFHTCGNPYCTDPEHKITLSNSWGFRRGVEAQCRLLANEGYRKMCFCDPLYSGEEHCSGFCAELREQGYRKVPSVIEMATKLDEVLPLCKDYIDPIDSTAKVICRWLLERE